MTEVDSDIIKPEMMKSYVWLQTSDGSIQQVEQEVAIFCPFICHEIHSGMGSSKNYPITLPPRVNPPMLSLIFDYCRFHQVPGHSNKERNLQLKPLVDLTSRALARVIEGRSPEEIREIFHLPDDLTEEEKLEPIKNTMDDPRIRLLNRLYARKRKELQERERLKYAEVEEEHVDDRSVDDPLVIYQWRKWSSSIMLFLHVLDFCCLSFRNSKEARTSKTKKKNRRRKEHQKNAPLNCTSTSNSTSSSSNAVDLNNKDSNVLNSEFRDALVRGNFLPSLGKTSKLLDIEDDRFAGEDEFDDDDGDLDDDIDPAIKEKIDREVEDFARRLNSDWPERMQEILSLGQERRTLPVSINGNGSLRGFMLLPHPRLHKAQPLAPQCDDDVILPSSTTSFCATVAVPTVITLCLLV
ncbi:SKP1-like protein 21 [Abeliophyllum distichum]|uniref:SKP1-like protein 21 n=1 Tax=Abeliophyllum distichum TaxID=126358 RepID=A0ABD1TF44_9LAMI